MEIESVLGLAVRMGLDVMLRDLIGSDVQILTKTIEGLARENPAVVYKFVLDRLRAGDLELGQFVEAWRSMNSKANGLPESEPSWDSFPAHLYLI